VDPRVDQPKAASRTSGARQARPAWSLSAHAQRLITLGLVGLILAVITRRPEFAGVAAPAVLLLAARRPDRPGRIGVTVRPSATEMTEGEHADLRVTVTGAGEHSVDMLVHPRFAVVPGAPGGPAPGSSAPGDAVPSGPAPGGPAASAPAASAPAADGPAAGGPAADGPPGNGRTSSGDTGLPFHITRTGRRSLGTLEITLRDRLRLTEGHITIELPTVNCYPQPAAQRTRVVLSRLPSRLGEHPSRSSGEGVEFTGVREFVPGDRQRRINWPATTRRGRLQLNTFAAERTQNVVIIADASSDVGEPGATPVDLAFRGSAAAARAYLAVRDRVGFIVYQRSVRWVTPGLGARQYYRIMNLMLAGPVLARPLSRDPVITRLPRAALPPGSLILVFSPLLDRRLVETLRDLRERGFSILIVDVLNAEPSGRTDSLSGLARRIWRMEQDAIRFSLRELGIPLVRWDGVQSLDEPLAPYAKRVMVSRR
jgi:uncharacterized protein (DUF58 family)